MNACFQGDLLRLDSAVLAMTLRWQWESLRTIAIANVEENIERGISVLAPALEFGAAAASQTLLQIAEVGWLPHYE